MPLRLDKTLKQIRCHEASEQHTSKSGSSSSNHPLQVPQQYNMVLTGDRQRGTGVTETQTKSFICADRLGRPHFRNVRQEASARTVLYSATGSAARQTGWSNGQGLLRATQKRDGRLEMKYELSLSAPLKLSQRLALNRSEKSKLSPQLRLLKGKAQKRRLGTARDRPLLIRTH